MITVAIAGAAVGVALSVVGTQAQGLAASSASVKNF
jgi:hypothetical protein